MLGRDGTAITLAHFAGRLNTATLTRPANSAIDPNDPTAAPTGSPTTYSCQGFAFVYDVRDIDGTRVMKGDYQVTLLRGSLSVMPQPGDAITIPPPGSSTPATARVIAVAGVTEATATLQVRG